MQDKDRNVDLDGQLLMFDKYNWLKPAEDNMYNVNQGEKDPENDHFDDSITVWVIGKHFTGSRK